MRIDGREPEAMRIGRCAPAIGFGSGHGPERASHGYRLLLARHAQAHINARHRTSRVAASRIGLQGGAPSDVDQRAGLVPGEAADPARLVHGFKLARSTLRWNVSGSVPQARATAS